MDQLYTSICYYCRLKLLFPFKKAVVHIYTKDGKLYSVEKDTVGYFYYDEDDPDLFLYDFERSVLDNMNIACVIAFYTYYDRNLNKNSPSNVLFGDIENIPIIE